jgi:hypothetical protein
MKLTIVIPLTLGLSSILAFPLYGQTASQPTSPSATQEPRATASTSKEQPTSKANQDATPYDVYAAVTSDARPWNASRAGAIVREIPRADAVKIFGAFLTVQVRRDRLMTCLQNYISALRGGGYLTKVEMNLAVIDAGNALDRALNNLESLVTPYSLLSPNAVQLTQQYVTGKQRPVVQRIEIERGIFLTIDLTDAQDFLHQMQQNTASFENAYHAFGDSILSAYGAEVISEATHVSTAAP